VAAVAAAVVGLLLTPYAWLAPAEYWKGVRYQVGFHYAAGGARPSYLANLGGLLGEWLGALGIVGAALMIAGLGLGVGMDVAWLPALILVAALAAAAFTAIIQALVVAFGNRGWLVGLLLAAVQAAACGTPYLVDSLPAPLAFLHPLLPVTWAADAFRACIEGTASGLAPAVLLLAGSLVGALLVTLAVAFAPDRPTAAAAAPA